uniref:Uncharacterized protein n=1 Tax=Arundo donax TaxID=35708 RepID=A0A0A9FJB3_ARUDO
MHNLSCRARTGCKILQRNWRHKSVTSYKDRNSWELYPTRQRQNDGPKMNNAHLLLSNAGWLDDGKKERKRRGKESVVGLARSATAFMSRASRPWPPSLRPGQARP